MNLARWHVNCSHTHGPYFDSTGSVYEPMGRGAKGIRWCRLRALIGPAAVALSLALVHPAPAAGATDPAAPVRVFLPDPRVDGAAVVHFDLDREVALVRVVLPRRVIGRVRKAVAELPRDGNGIFEALRRCGAGAEQRTQGESERASAAQ